MANELDYGFGLDVSFQLQLANPSANASTAMVLSAAGGNPGFVVPTGYKFHPVCLSLASNADLSAGTILAKVTDNTTAILNGPQPVLSDEVQKATGIARVGIAPIAAGHVVGVTLTADANYLPVTADYDAILIGKLLPA